MTDTQIDRRLDGRTREARALKAEQSRGGLSQSESLARAEARLREIRGDATDFGENRDRFWAPEPPDGWSYQWKRRTIYNQEDPSYQVELMRQGWEAVPLDRHPEMMPRGWSGKTIEVDGLVLMERPKVLTDEARAREYREARSAVLTKEQQLGIAPKGHMERARKAQVLSKSYEPIGIPDEE